MKVIEVTEPQGWDEWLAKSRFGDVLQSWEWGEVKKSELWKALRIRVVEDEKVLAQAQILTRKMPLNMTLYYLPRGPVLDYTRPTAIDILRTILDWTKEHAIQHRGLMIKLGPAVSRADNPDILGIFEQLGLKQSFRSVQAEHTYIVDLNRSEAEIVQSFDKDTRNLVRRSAREGITVERFDTLERQKGLRTFHNLYLAAAEHNKFAPRPWSQFTKTWEVMAPVGMARVYLASFGELALAGNMLLLLGSRAYQLWGGSRRDEPKKFATYALQWAAMQDLKADGVKEYDMWGRAPTDDPQHPFAGLSLFKKGFGGREVSFVGEFDLPLSPIYPLATTAERIRGQVLNRR